jgi:pimeloyl-ACP methyl ester carboxylesterase
MTNSSAVWSDEAGPAGAPVVVLVHGAMDRSSGMLKVSRRLDERYRVVRYDRRGYAKSIDHPGPFSMDGQVDDLEAVVAGRQVVIVGHSYGGNVALAFAERRPELVAAVGVYEIPMSFEPWWQGSTARAVASDATRTPADAAEGFMRRFIGDTRWDALPERTRAARRAEGAALVGELADLRANRPWHAERLQLPIVVGYGTKGSPHHQDGMRRLGGMLPDAQTVVLDGCRHDAPNSAPAVFAAEFVVPLLERAGGRWAAQLTEQ